MGTTRRHPNADWPLWKVIGAGFLSFGGFALILAFMPPQSVVTILLSIVLALMAVTASVWNWKSYNWASRMTLGGLWTIQLLAIGFRAWSEVYSIAWVYPTICAYFLAWALPALGPALSELLWREQTAPQTRLGQLLLGVAISFIPVAGALGANVGMFSSRFDGISGVYLIIGPLFFVLAIGMAFAFAHQFWPDRPWAKRDKGST